MIDHAQGFVSALVEVRGTVVDLGSGGGVPGLVIAVERPDLELILVDRRTARIDLLNRIVARLGYAQRVRTVCADARHVADEPWVPADAVVARSFAAPHDTLAVARSLIGSAGVVVISEPPVGDRWNVRTVAGLGLRQRALSAHSESRRVAVFECST